MTPIAGAEDNPGDSIPADARIIECTNLKVEEAALTGESVPVDKHSNFIEKEDIALGDMKNCLFSSTYVTNGKARAMQKRSKCNP